MQHHFLDGTTDHQYTAMDATTSPWRNADCAMTLANSHGTDTMASIQLDIRMPRFLKFSEVDPLDVAGMLGEISGFWLVVPLMFGLIFHRRQVSDDQRAEMRQFKKLRCLCGRTTRQDFS